MSSMIAPALSYILFAVSFLLTGYLVQINKFSQIYDATIQRFIQTPWTLSPDKTVLELEGPADVYTWLTTAFLNQLYYEGPSIGDENGFCTEGFQCGLHQGIARNDNQCGQYFKAGDRNCATFLGAGASCCEPCTGSTCPNFTLTLQDYQLVNTTACDDLSASCSDEMPDWLEDLAGWGGGKTNTAPATDLTFCPERASTVNADLTTRAQGLGRLLTVAQYNRVLMARVSMKRIKIIPHDSKAFSNAYPLMMSSEYIIANTYNPNVENTSSFGRTKTYNYKQDKGFQNAGGFVEYIDLSDTKDRVLQQVSELQDNYWFDLYQGSFVLDFIMFNGNVDKFIYVAFVFEHHFSGLTKTRVIASPLDLDMHNPKEPLTYLRLFLYVVMAVLYLYFIRTELADIAAEKANYFANFLSWLHIASLVLTGFCFWSLGTITLDYEFLNFDFPLPIDPEKRAQAFDDLGTLALRMETYVFMLSVNALLVFVRVIYISTGLQPELGVVFNVLSHMRYNLVAFMCMFIVMLLGFMFAGFYLFGAKIEEYSTVAKSFVTCLQMIMRLSNFQKLEDGDGQVGFFFFILFHLFFLIVQQMLLSIIISGYDKEKDAISKLRPEDRYPLRRVLKQLQAALKEYSTPFQKCVLQLSQVCRCFGGSDGSAMRINYDEVARLRDRRPTQKRIRNVTYERKPDEDKDTRVTPDTDITLRAVEPFYPDGLMHYVVEGVAPEGTASEAKVTKDGNFRLVEITQQGVTTMEFREKEKFKENGSDPKKFLQEQANKMNDSPVTLKFEGKVRPVSPQCCMLIIFITVFTIWSIIISRVEDSYSLAVTQEDALKTPVWEEYNPRRSISFNTMSRMDSLVSWMDASILQSEYSCVTSLENEEGCRWSILTQAFREDWGLFTGVLGEQGKTFDVQHQLNPAPETRSKGAMGLSMGYLPRTVAEIKQTPRFAEYNVGVMPNNHVRLTFQVACFEHNKNNRWRSGYPQKVNEVVRRSSGCAHQACMREMIQGGYECLDSEGSVRDPRQIVGEWSDIKYTFAEDGTYESLGGIAIGLGNTQAEAKLALLTMNRDRLMQKNTISFAFEFVTYNGHLDLFTYTLVTVNLLSTGKLDKEVFSAVFPLSVFSHGQKSNTKVFKTGAIILCIVYALLTLWSLASLLNDMFIQYRITTELQHNWYMFFPEFFQEDWWNFIDVTSCVLNIMVLYFLMRFLLIEATLDKRDGIPFSSWTFNKYEFELGVTQDTTDQIDRFARAANYYTMFSRVMSVNGLFIWFRLIKYFGALPQLRLVMTTLSSAILELLIMSLILAVMQMGFTFMFYTKFGIQFHRYGEFIMAFQELFLFLVGRFNLTDLMDQDPIFFTFAFTTYQVLFFLLINMYLAAIVYRWMDTRKDAQELSVVSFYNKFKEFFFHDSHKPNDKKSPQVMLDKEFWRKHAVLNHLQNLEETGVIHDVNSNEHKAKSKSMPTHMEENRNGDALAMEDAKAEEREDEADGGHRKIDFSKDDCDKKLLAIFKKAHMEIASQLCRQVPDEPVDGGHGVGALDGEEGEARAVDADAGMDDNDGQPLDIGIIEEAVDVETSTDITSRLDDELMNLAHPAQEVWLDALITVLEDNNALDKLQKTFLPARMMTPKKAQEWGFFNERKRKMESRLNLFLKWLKEETNIKHYNFLREQAQAKERVLKQQSLVLMDYLEQLDDRIVKLSKEIEQLERRNSEMRKHVAPLL